MSGPTKISQISPRRKTDNRSTASPASTQRDNPPPANIDANDDLLDCLLHVSKFHDCPLTAVTATSGLPLKDGFLTPSSLIRSAGRAGLTAHIGRKPIDNISPMVFPCILLTKERGACVVHNRKKEGFTIYNPQAGRELFFVTPESLKAQYKGHFIALKPFALASAEVQKSNLATRQGHWFWSVVKSLSPQYFQVGLASFLANCLAIATPLFMLNVYDRVLPNSAFSTLWILAIGMAIVLLFELIFRMLRGRITDRAGRYADMQLASRIFDHVLRMRLEERPQSSGAFANRLREFETVREFFSSASLIAIIDVFFIAIFIAVISLVGGPLIIVPLVGVTCVLIYGLIIQPVMMKSVRSVQEEATQKHSLLIETLAGIDTIKAANAEGEILRRWENIVDKTARSTERVRFISMNIVNVTMLIQQCVSIALVIYGVYLFDAGMISMGAIIAVVMLAGRAVAPLGAVATTISRSQQSFIALRNLNMFMKTEYENDDNNYQVAQPITKGDIELSSVFFTYPETERPALDAINLNITAGEKVGIIGKVGAGKSTLVHLITALYRPTAGTLKFDGINASQLHTAEIRKAMGIVLQDVVLFQGTARENIAFGNRGVSDGEIIRAAKMSGADSFISEHPLGFGMPVGERGQMLSGGQRQFIALTRAVLKDPPIYVLDEPTSAMDSTSEAMFIKRLQDVSKNKTVIISTHRQSLLTMCDKLILIDKGKIIAFGTKAEVMAFLQSSIQNNEPQSSASHSGERSRKEEMRVKKFVG